MFYKFILHIGNSEWTSKELFDGSCDFPSLRSHSIDFSKWLIDVVPSLEPHEFLVLTALVQRSWLFLSMILVILCFLLMIF